MSNQLSLPMYVKSNASLYERIANEFHTEIAKAHTKEEYEKTLASLCTRWAYEFTDEYVQQYMLYSGEMDAEEIEAIKNYYLCNAKPLQKAVLDAKLESGKKYTLLYYNEFGFPVADKIVFERVSITQYAQYKDAVKMVFKRARNRASSEVYFYDCSLAIYEGWHDLNELDTYETVSETKDVRIKRSKYNCFDPAYFAEIIKRLGAPLMQYTNLSIRESDGRVFA